MFTIVFLNSFVPGYKVGFFGHFILSNIIILKPEVSYRQYAINQKKDFDLAIEQNVKQEYMTFSTDLNFDIELPNRWSLIFGMGIDYIIVQKNTIYFENFTDTYTQDSALLFNDQRLDPFANIGFCYKLKNNLLLDIEYRHLLDNWNTVNNSEFIAAGNGSVKLHMINFSLAFLL